MFQTCTLTTGGLHITMVGCFASHWLQQQARHRSAYERIERPNSWMLLRQKSQDFSILIFTVTSTNGFYSLPPPPLCKSGLKLVCNINIVHRNLKSEFFQVYAQKPQRNYMFMNSALAYRNRSLYVHLLVLFLNAVQCSARCVLYIYTLKTVI
jgi:hypothetical protein